MEKRERGTKKMKKEEKGELNSNILNSNIQGRKGRTTVNCRVRSTVNNTKVVRTWYDEEKGRRVNKVKTAGIRGYKNAKRGSVYAGQELRASVGKRYMERWQGKEKPGVNVFRRGMGRGRIQALNELKKAGVEILTVSDATKDGHNGCRRKKRRRV